jgi:hypothetical protein
VLVGVAAAVMLVLGAGISGYAAEPSTAEPTTPAATCGSVDPGFAIELKDFVRGKEGGVDPGFGPPPGYEDAPAGAHLTDPGFSQPISSCPAERLQDMLVVPDAGLPISNASPIATPADVR